MSVTQQAVPGTVITTGNLISPSGGQGPQGITAVSTDVGNLAVLGSDNLVSVPTSNVTPVIWSVRYRSYSAIGNGNFEVDQRNVGTAVAVTPTNMGWGCDRWWNWCAGTMRYNTQQQNNNTVIPGTNYLISSKMLRITMTTTQASLGANDIMGIGNDIEGPCLRELFNDVHSMSILCRSSVANLKFGVSLNDAAPTPTRSLTKLCSLGAANTWTLIQLNNLPVFPVAGTFPLTPGSAGYFMQIILACGSTYTSPVNDTWQTGYYVAAAGQSNFAANAGATFDLAFVQHEPGSQCSTLMDIPFNQNLQACKRYYAKCSPYSNTVPGGPMYMVGMTINPNQSTIRCGVRYEVEMAKAPSTLIWDNANTPNACFVDGYGAGIVVVGGGGGISSDARGWISFSVTTTIVNTAPASAQWTADTDW
jgi:hypothetical protein